jgi:hypothetical protein
MEDVNEKMDRVWKSFVYEIENTNITSVKQLEQMLNDSIKRVDAPVKKLFKEKGKFFLSNWIKKYFNN